MLYKYQIFLKIIHKKIDNTQENQNIKNINLINGIMQVKKLNKKEKTTY